MVIYYNHFKSTTKPTYALEIRHGPLNRLISELAFRSVVSLRFVANEAGILDHRVQLVRASNRVRPGVRNRRRRIALGVQCADGR